MRFSTYSAVCLSCLREDCRLVASRTLAGSAELLRRTAASLIDLRGGLAKLVLLPLDPRASAEGSSLLSVLSRLALALFLLRRLLDLEFSSSEVGSDSVRKMANLPPDPSRSGVLCMRWSM